jgi:predicted ABC-type transport system involved in lysophospholipase L1 biosynthesis ATPase subunit
VSAAVLEFAGTSKAYGGLRPLRIAELRVHAGDSVALLGFDQPTAEVFVNLATGATLPDAGEVSIFGLPTRAIEDSADWLATIDRFGIVSERAVLLDALTVIQNLAMPFTLEIEPPPDAVRRRAEALARDVGLPEASWGRPVGELDPAGVLRVRAGRAIALDPAIVLFEHASARLPREEIAAVGTGLRGVVARRGIALLALSADEEFAQAVATRVLTLEPASGHLKERRRGWFGLG